MKFRNFIFVIILISFVISLFIGSKKIYNYYSWADDRTTIYPNIRILPDDTIRIIIIGDSWAAYHHKNDTILGAMLQKKLHKPVSVVSSGMVGAKTKAIYELLFDTISANGTQRLIASHPNYCIIFAGINDAIAKMGVDNYLHHYSLILKQLCSNIIKPVIVDIPNVDYYNAYKREPVFMRIRHRLSSVIWETSMWNYDEYKNALVNYLSDNQLSNQTIYVRNRWNKDGYKDERQLYLLDNIHLNSKGYWLLDSIIAEEISNH